MAADSRRIPWLVRGDLDGFFGLAVDNLVQFLLIVALLGTQVGLSAGFIASRVLPGAAVSLLLGNLFYAWQARRLAARTGRRDVTALPYGINTVSLFAFVLFIMAPTYQELAADPGVGPERAGVIAWQVGLVACFLSGVIEALGALVAGRVRRATPRAALLSTLAGIALGFISMEFLARTFDRPLVAVLPLGVLLLTYFSRIRLPGGLPGGLVAVAAGTALAWALPALGLPGAASWEAEAPVSTLGLHPPRSSLADLLAVLGSPLVWDRISIILPMGLLNVLGSLQNVESAEAEGDRFATGPSLAVNGLGSMVAACFGSCFPTTIYIGHPGWKRMGARWGYSILNGLFFTAVALTGLMGTLARVVPVEAAMGILIWIAIVITAQAFGATPREHAPAVVLGLLPGLAAWGWLMIETGQLGFKIGGALPWSADLEGLLAALPPNLRPYLEGLIALRAGFMFSGLVLAALGVGLIERRFGRAALWALAGALLSLAGLMHSWAVTATAVREQIRLGFAWPAAAAYLGLAALFALAGRIDRWRGEPSR